MVLKIWAFSNRKAERKKKQVNLAGPTLGTTDLGSIYISLKTYPAKQISSDRVAEKRHTAIAVVSTLEVLRTSTRG